MSPRPKGSKFPGTGWGDPSHPMHRPAKGVYKPAEEGNELAVTHGARSRSNRLVMPAAAVLEAEVLETVEYLRDPSYAPAVRRWAIAEAWCDRLGAWLEENGAIEAEGKVKPVLDSLRLWQQRASQEADRLGLTPAARVKFERDVSTTRVNLARLMEEQDSDGE